MEAQMNSLDNNSILSENRNKWFMEMLAIKKDAGMTRIYSAISSPKTESQNQQLPDTDLYDDLDF